MCMRMCVAALHLCAFIFVGELVYVCVHACIVYACVYLCMYVYMYICLYTSINVVFMYISFQGSSKIMVFIASRCVLNAFSVIYRVVLKHTCLAQRFKLTSKRVCRYAWQQKSWQAEGFCNIHT